MHSKLKIIVLAAGKGKRMQSELPKVLAPVKGRPMIDHIHESISGFHNEKPIAIIGYGADLVKSTLGDKFVYVIQEEQLGTGHATAIAEEACGDAEYIMVLYGDQPFVGTETLKKLLDTHIKSGATLTFTTFDVPEFEGKYKVLFGRDARILRKDGKLVGNREFKDTTEEERMIKEVNKGNFVFDAKWLWSNLKKVEKSKVSGEYYLTDLIHLALKENKKIETVKISFEEAMTANSKEELEILEEFANNEDQVS